jgi:hypothetical protein
LSLYAVSLLLVADPARASAWNQSARSGQVILKYEQMDSVKGFDADGRPVELSSNRQDQALSSLVEYGLTGDLTLRLKGEWQSGQDMFVDYSGRGPLQVGIAWQAYRTDRDAVSLYAGVASGGEGRNAGYASPGQGDRDWEARLLAGRSFAASRWAPHGAYAEIQAAHLWREGLVNEARVDATLGVNVARDWTAMAQAFGGRTSNDGARWLSVESSVVRRLGRWSLQAGWRRTVAGRNTAVAEGPVVAIWRRF